MRVDAAEERGSELEFGCTEMALSGMGKEGFSRKQRDGVMEDLVGLVADLNKQNCINR